MYWRCPQQQRYELESAQALNAGRGRRTKHTVVNPRAHHHAVPSPKWKARAEIFRSLWDQTLGRLDCTVASIFSTSYLCSGVQDSQGLSQRTGQWHCSIASLKPLLNRPLRQTEPTTITRNRRAVEIRPSTVDLRSRGASVQGVSVEGFLI